MKYKLILLLILLFRFPTDLFAGYIKHYTINDGLANNAIYSIFQDSKGLMWFGSIDGLHSFDGNQIRVWRNDTIPTLGNYIYSIQEDENKMLWLGTDKGIAIFDLKTEKFLDFNKNFFPDIDINIPVSKVLLDAKHNIWIATKGQGIFYIDTQKQAIKNYTKNNQINSNYIMNLMEDHTGLIWAVSLNKGISCFNKQTDTFIPKTSHQFRSNIVMFEDSQNNLWVGNSNEGLLLFDKRNNELKQIIKPFKKNQPLKIRSIVEWHPGILFLASDEGLTSYNIADSTYNRWTFNNKEYGLNDNYLHSLFIDKEKALWIGTYFGGINYISPINKNFKHYSKDNSNFKARIISTFAQGDNNNLWIGSDDAGFFYWDRNHNTFKSYFPNNSQQSPTYRNVHALLQDGDKLYIGMYLGGLDVLDLNTGEIRNYKRDNSSSQSLYSNEIYALYKDIHGYIWVGTTLGLNKFDTKLQSFERIPQLVNADISSIQEDTNGNLWVGSRNKGIFRFNTQTNIWEHYDQINKTPPFSTPSNSIETIAQDKYGNLWIGTNGDGILKYSKSNNSFEKLLLPENIRVIQKIIAYGDALWISTNKGIYEYLITEGYVRTYNKYDGLQDDYFLPSSGIQLSDGTIYFGGINGFNEFHPNKIINNPNKPAVILTDFRLFNKPIEIGSKHSPLQTSITYSDKLVLKDNQFIFSFSVTTLSYINTEKNLYKYKLENFDLDWIETNKSPRVSYSNLPPGKYTFKVAVSNGTGTWFDNAIVFPIEILPPWWASTTAIILYILLSIGFIIYLFILINRKHNKKLQLITEEKDKEIYQSKVEFFTLMIHEIRTPLTLILAPLENIMKSRSTVMEVMPQLQMMERNSKRLLALINQLMDYRKIENGKIDIHLVKADLTPILKDICQQFSLPAELKDIKLIINHTPEPVYAYIDEEAFTKVISNLLSNALKFTDNYIWITLSKTPDGNIKLSIQDNGCGISIENQQKIFQPFFQIKDNRPTDNIGTGIGLLLVKKMVDLMSGTLTLESKLGEGSTFSIYLKACDDLTESNSVSKDEALKKIHTIHSESITQKTHHILIVDDNDDLRGYLDSLLQNTYQVTCASNGKEALSLLSTDSIDLVITDVIMPVMDGIELCKSIKTNLKYSHIPVIMLTAKFTTENQIKGLDSGADLYIEKPFSSEVIKAQIASIIKNRERIKGNFLIDNQLAPKTDSLSSLDKKFFNKVTNLILERISDSDLNIDFIAKEIGISRTGIFTKMKAVSGMTPSEYIRVVRLKKASELLITSSDQISEICFQVGFSSPSYFTKCFQNQFGVSPSEFKSKQIKKQ